MPFVTSPAQRRVGNLAWACDSIAEVRNLVSGDALFVEDVKTGGALMFLIVDIMGHGTPAALVVDVVETD
jgi:hypothetical protein